MFVGVRLSFHLRTFIIRTLFLAPLDSDFLLLIGWQGSVLNLFFHPTVLGSNPSCLPTSRLVQLTWERGSPFFHYLFLKSALISAADGAARIFPTTLCGGVIQTHLSRVAPD